MAILRELERFLLELGGDFTFGVNPKNETASQGNKYIEWSEEWICPEVFTVAI
jgi:predicted nuclease of restriction endonuclease-like (RecB) superfamily